MGADVLDPVLEGRSQSPQRMRHRGDAFGSGGPRPRPCRRLVTNGDARAPRPILVSVPGEKMRPPQRFLPRMAQLFYSLRFGRPDPQGREIAKYCVFRAFWPRAAPWHSEKFRAENRKTRFPRARGTFGGKNWTPKSFSRKLRNFFTFCGLTDRTPRGGKLQHTGFLGPFGLGQPLGT